MKTLSHTSTHIATVGAVAAYQTQDDSTPCVQVKQGAEYKNVPESSRSVSVCLYVGMAMERDEIVLRLEDPFHFAVIDEVDSVLIDEGRNPALISRPSAKGSER